MMMISLFLGTVSVIGSLFKSFQVKKVLSIMLVGLLILTTNIDPGVMSKQEATQKVNKMLDRDDNNRPKTTGEWQKQAREVKGEPIERAKRIGEQSADAVKDFGKMYPDVAKRSENELENSTKTNR
jgi:hypothetical protein